MARKSNPISEEVKEEVAVETAKVDESPVVDNDIIDIDFKEVRKQRFRIAGDNNRILELDISDLSTMNRIEESYPRLVALEQKANLLKVTGDEGEQVDVIQTLKDIDTEMRSIIDFMFDSNVSEMCAPTGTMFDPYNGKFRYEHITDKITELYQNNLNKEFNLFKKRINKHTDKYTKR